MKGHSIIKNSKPVALVMDDDLAYLELLSERMKELGCDVDPVTTVNEAESLVRRKKYNIVICDNIFADSTTTGSEFLFRNKALLGKAKIVLCTGWPLSQIRHRDELNSAGVSIIAKGIGHFETLKQIVDQTVVDDNKLVAHVGQDVLAFAVFGKKIKVVSLMPDGSYRFLDEGQSLHNILYVTSSETLALQRAVEELEELINDKNSKEEDFQAFFERNPDFILNEEYARAHPHVVLSNTAQESLVPDFLLEPIDQSSLCDILELKTPSAPVFVLKKNRMRFSSAVSEACAQLLEYSRFFDEQINRDIVYRRYGLTAYKPKMILVIGRLGSVSPLDRRKIHDTQPALQLHTYDDILRRVRKRIERMRHGKIISYDPKASESHSKPTSYNRTYIEREGKRFARSRFIGMLTAFPYSIT